MQSSAVASRQPSAVQSSAVRPLQVALTFDDGPHQTCTPALLNGLKQREVKATFFLMGENIAGKEPLVQRMQAEGHLIGNHGYRHIQMTKEEAEQACADIEQTENSSSPSPGNGRSICALHTVTGMSSWNAG